MPHRPGTPGQGGAARPSDAHLELSVLTRSSLSNPSSATALLSHPGISRNISTSTSTLWDAVRLEQDKPREAL